eukprot:g10142.t1
MEGENMQSPAATTKNRPVDKKQKVQEVPLGTTMKVLVFYREGYPYFSLREFDGKILRAPSLEQKSLRIQGASEQAIRARITQAILKLKLKPIKANKEEIRYLKKKGVLGKRAPKCSLLTCSDMGRLLKAFGRHADAAHLVAAVEQLDCEKGSPVLENIGESALSPSAAAKAAAEKESRKRIKRTIEFPNGPNQQPRPRRKRKKEVMPSLAPPMGLVGGPMGMGGMYAQPGPPGYLPAKTYGANGNYMWHGQLGQPAQLPHPHMSIVEYATGHHSPTDMTPRYDSLSPQVGTPPIPNYLARESTSPISSPRTESPNSDNSGDSTIPLTPLSAVSHSTYGSPNTEPFIFSPIAHKIRPIDHQIYLLSPVQAPTSMPQGLTKTTQADEAYLAMCSTLQPLGDSINMCIPMLDVFAHRASIMLDVLSTAYPPPTTSKYRTFECLTARWLCPTQPLANSRRGLGLRPTVMLRQAFVEI